MDEHCFLQYKELLQLVDMNKQNIHISPLQKDYTINEYFME